MKTGQQFPLFKLPSKTQVSLCLIGEELKCRKLFKKLREIGLDDCYLQPHLNELILKGIGLQEYSDETFARYNAIVDKRSEKIEEGNQSIARQAFKTYMELMTLKQEMRNK